VLSVSRAVLSLAVLGAALLGCGPVLPPCAEIQRDHAESPTLATGFPESVAPCLKGSARGRACICAAETECASVVIDGCYREHFCIPRYALRCLEGKVLRVLETCPPIHQCIAPP
jgi:hypothetical protein